MPKNDIFDSFCQTNKNESILQSRPHAEFIQTQPPISLEIGDSIWRDAEWENSLIDSKDSYQAFNLNDIIMSEVEKILMKKEVEYNYKIQSLNKKVEKLENQLKILQTSKKNNICNSPKKVTLQIKNNIESSSRQAIQNNLAFMSRRLRDRKAESIEKLKDSSTSASSFSKSSVLKPITINNNNKENKKGDYASMLNYLRTKDGAKKKENVKKHSMSYFKPQQRTSSNSNSSNKASNVNCNRYKSKVNSRNSSEVHKKVYKNSSCLNWKSKETPKDIGTFELMRESLSNFLCDQDEKQEDDKLPQRGVPVCPKFNAKFQDFAKNKCAAYDYPIKASKDRMKNLSSKVDEQTNLCTCTAEDKAELDSLNASDTFRSLTYDLLEHSTNNLPNNFSSPKPVNCNQNFHIKMPKEACGRYCVFVSSETQKSIIRNCFQIIDLSQRDCGIRYAISSDWWREWCDYVNIEFYDPSDQSNSNAGMMVKEVSSILIEEDSFNCSDSSSANKKSNGSPVILNSYGSPQSNSQMSLNLMKSDIYRRPQKIVNKGICAYNPDFDDMVLKSGMQRIYNYVGINSCGWRYLKSWYGCDFEVIIDPSEIAFLSELSKVSI